MALLDIKKPNWLRIFEAEVAYPAFDPQPGDIVGVVGKYATYTGQVQDVDYERGLYMVMVYQDLLDCFTTKCFRFEQLCELEYEDESETE